MLIKVGSVVYGASGLCLFPLPQKTTLRRPNLALPTFCISSRSVAIFSFGTALVCGTEGARQGDVGLRLQIGLFRTESVVSLHLTRSLRIIVPANDASRFWPTDCASFRWRRLYTFPCTSPGRTSTLMHNNIFKVFAGCRCV